MKKYLRIILCHLLVLAPTLGHAAVILQYHHVSDDTPASTSISPQQFSVHMQYLADNSYRVVALSEIINSIKKQQPIPDKTVAITFDDAYIDIVDNAKPILDQFNYPYTIFVNPSLIKEVSKHYLTWAQLKALTDEGVIIANHGFEHDSLARIPTNMTTTQWLQKQTALLLKSEQQLQENIGQQWRYFAYPYGEFTPAIQQWIAQNNFVAFSQQSGAVGLATDLTAVPRFPVSQPYDKLSSLKDKLNSLPFAMTIENQQQGNVFEFDTVQSVRFNVLEDDFHKSQLNCYVTGLGRQKITWQTEHIFAINFNGSLPVGRVRSNCTAPSISQPGRYYWHSQPWFILHKGRNWYPL